jgi:tRNA modification GTPase
VHSPFDLIVAPITAPGGAVGIIRVSGDRAWNVASKACLKWPKKPQSHRAFFTDYVNGDDGLVTLFESGKSYTGEESVELSTHGSPAAIRTLVDEILKNGARMARPGEFTERAFLNGRLDLTQAEAVNDTVRAATERQLSSANSGRNGELKESLLVAEDKLAKVLAAIEASVDFSEEIGDVDVPMALQNLEASAQIFRSWVDKAERGRLIREGIRIAIVGPPNAGKSSLLNRLLGVQRSIVTNIEGTTRDYVEEQIEMGGLLCVLIDTAGLRDTEDEVESIGIQRARAQAASADLIWYVFDATGELPKPLPDVDPEKVWWIANKSDLVQSRSYENVFYISTYTAEGIESLIQELGKSTQDISGAIPNARHRAHLEQGLEAIELAIAGFRMEHPSDLVVTHIRAALYDIGQITGSTATEDLLTRIFSDFCIGK